MRVVDRFPRSVRDLENLFITMRDGARLAAKLWLPDDAERNPVPAVLEYMPYRKRDHSRTRDEPIHRYFAGHGYASIRVDSRGSGDSDGVLGGEWLERELEDGVEIVEWLARQPWCTGSVGMIGKSWGGFTALQLAGLAPPALKAVIPVCCGDDRYHQSLHYTGGTFLVEQLWWAATMAQFNMRPPDPEIVGDGWRELWRQRLDANDCWLEVWLNHQRRDAFWKHASVCEDFGKIRAAVFAVGGWADYLSRSIPRLMQHLSGPRRGLIGPWGHFYPEEGEPGAPIGFLQECLRWYDRWLKGVENGVEREPILRVWLQEALPPHAEGKARPGRWVAERQWPSPGIRERRWALNPQRLDARASPEQAIVHRSPLAVGLAAGEWLSMGVPGEQAGDQREDDARSLVFDSQPLPRPLEILGSAVVELQLAADREAPQLCLRLCDVAADGSSARVVFQPYNLTHRDSHEAPSPLEPGKRYRVRIELPPTAYRFQQGHRIRLAISTSYWPIVWPAPEPATITIFTGASRLALPVRSPRPADQRLRPFAEPEHAAPVPITILEPAKIERLQTRDVIRGELITRQRFDGALLGPGRRWRIDPIGTVLGHAITKTFRIEESDPTSATGEIEQEYNVERGDWRIRIETRIRLGATDREFVIDASAKAFEGDALISDRTWNRRVRRDLM